VLLLGPLYHLPERADRERTLAEAFRVLRPGGIVFAAGISRLSPLLDGIFGAPTGRPESPLPLRLGLKIVLDALRTGRYSNPVGDPNMFTTAYMHMPAELVAEIENAGFDCREVCATEGPGAWLPGFHSVYRRKRGRCLLEKIAEKASLMPWLRGLTPHLLVVAQKPV
jgi:SAM-dependent methyltransferase